MDQNHGGVVKESLESVVDRIVALAKESDELILEAASRLKELRNRVEAGEAGEGIKWHRWAKENIPLSESWIRELMQIANAGNPSEKAEELRKRRNSRAAKNRAKQRASKHTAQSLEEERKKVRAWAEKAPLEDVRRILAKIEELSEDPGHETKQISLVPQSPARRDTAIAVEGRA